MVRIASAAVAPGIILLGLALAPSPGAAETQIQSRSFPAGPGDTLIVQNDSGRVRVRAWDAPEVRAQIERISSGKVPEELRVSTGKSGKEIVFHSFYSGQSAEAVNLDIQVPKFMNVAISGAFSEVEVHGIEGSARVRNVSGNIRLENLTSAVAAVSERGDILYRAEFQPKGDVRLETTAGNIRCELAANLNLRGTLRTGGTIVWGQDAIARGAALEKQLGSSGPLLNAASTKGDIQVSVGREGGGFMSASMSAQADERTASPSAATKRATPPAVPDSSPPEVQPATSPNNRAPGSPGIQPPPRVQPNSSSEAPRTASSTPPVAQPSADSTGAGVAIKVAVDAVLLNVSVRDRNTNRSIAGLQKDDFLVYEDNVQQEVQELLPTEAPFNLLLLLDVSGSTASYIGLMKQAATEFTREIKENDKIAVADFDSHVRLLQDFTNDRNLAARAISGIHPRGGTAFYDALWTCVDRYMRDVEGRKAIVVFTDGVDNQLLGRREDGSRTTFNQLYRRIQEIDTLIYTIFLDSEGRVPGMTGGPGRFPGGGYPRTGRSPFPWPVPIPSPYPSPGPSRRPFPGGRDEAAAYEAAREQLEAIAEQTGGRTYSPRRAEDLSGAYREVADDLRVQYLLSYASSNADSSGWRSIKVQVRDHPEAVVRTRKGYYARSAGSPSTAPSSRR